MNPRVLWPPIRPIRLGRAAWPMAVIVVALIGLAVLAIGHQRESQTVTITPRDVGRTIHLSTGQVLLVSLPRTDTGWSVWVSDLSVFDYKGEGTIAYSSDGKSQVISM